MKEFEPYKAINKTNFHIIKEVLMWGISNSKSPAEIATRISEKTDMPLDQARMIVQEEFIQAMQWAKEKE